LLANFLCRHDHFFNNHAGMGLTGITVLALDQGTYAKQKNQVYCSYWVHY
jgi:hypothetical protein